MRCRGKLQRIRAFARSVCNKDVVKLNMVSVKLFVNSALEEAVATASTTVTIIVLFVMQCENHIYFLDCLS